MSTTLWPGALDAFDLLGPGEYHENSSDLWNDLRAALESMEGTLGVDPRGQKADFDARMSVMFNDDGAYKGISFGLIGGGDLEPSRGGHSVTHSSAGKFASAPYVFCQIAVQGNWNPNGPGIITVDSVTTTSVTFYGKKLGGSAPPVSPTNPFMYIVLAKEAAFYAL